MVRLSTRSAKCCRSQQEQATAEVTMYTHPSMRLYLPMYPTSKVDCSLRLALSSNASVLVTLWSTVMERFPSPIWCQSVILAYPRDIRRIKTRFGRRSRMRKIGGRRTLKIGLISIWSEEIGLQSRGATYMKTVYLRTISVSLQQMRWRPWLGACMQMLDFRGQVIMSLTTI